MQSNSASRGLRSVFALLTVLALVAAGCGSDAEEPETTESVETTAAAGETVAATLITKNSTNPFFVAMQEGAKEAGDATGVDVTIGAGLEDGDEDTQIQLIENAVVAGQDGILILSNGPGVEAALVKARDAGLFVIALDTPLDPPETADITFATDNRLAGQLIGEWAAAQLDGEKATIAMIYAFTDKVISVDVARAQGFLEGMGIDTADPMVNSDEASTGTYSGGEYEIVCNEPGEGSEDGGRTAMENCLTKNPDINVLYTINEPTAYGADAALVALGKNREDVLTVSVDGGCQAMDKINEGVVDATSQQYPLLMAKLGIEAIYQIATDGPTPENSPGLDFFNTGVELITNAPVEGLDSITADEGLDICWG